MEEKREMYPFLRFVIAPSRSFRRWSRTLVELTHQTRRSGQNEEGRIRVYTGHSGWGERLTEAASGLREGYAYL